MRERAERGPVRRIEIARAFSGEQRGVVERFGVVRVPVLDQGLCARADEEGRGRELDGVADVVEMDMRDADVLDVGGCEPALGERVYRVFRHGTNERHLPDALEILGSEALEVLSDTEVEDERVIVLGMTEEEGK